MSRSSFVVSSIILFIIGLVIISESVHWGNNATSAFIASHGGSIDTSVFTIILQEYIDLYRWVGIILSIIGGMVLVKNA